MVATKNTGKNTENKTSTSSKRKVNPEHAHLSPRLQKKAGKATSAARKLAGKSQVRLNRKHIRAAQQAEKSGKVTKDKKQNTKLQAGAGHAPHSARITPPRGLVQKLAARTEFTPKYSEDRQWLLIDAAGQTVGRLASEIAMLLRGKHKASFTPNNDAGDFVVVVNAEQVKFTAAKNEQKRYADYSGYIGGLKQYSPNRLREKFPERIIERAVKGMVPRSPLGRRQMAKLNVYAGPKHPHVAQNPVTWQLRYPSNRK